MSNDIQPGVETKVVPAPPQQGVETVIAGNMPPISQSAPADEPEETQPVVPVDYKALLEEELKKNQKIATERDNYKRGLLKAKKKVEENIEPEVEIEESNQETDIDAIVQQKVQEQISLNNSSTNPDERKLIKWYYDNKVVKSGDVAEDLELARAMANKNMILKVSSELKNSLQNNPNNVSNIGNSSGKDNSILTTKKFSESQIAELTKRGIDPDKLWKQMKDNEKGM